MNWKLYSLSTLLGVALLAAPAVYAATPAPVTQAQAEMSSGNLNGALQTLNTYLKTAPQDADARFTKGLVLTRLGKTDAAMKVFSALTRDYPQLPEPYNNLAVLYAQEGKYDDAREALKAALATHPSYATASENLGDVYAAMAAQAYDHALKVNKNDKQLRYKLSLINRLNAAPGSAVMNASVPGAAQPAAPTAPPTEVAAASPPPAPPAPPAASPAVAPATHESAAAPEKAPVTVASLAHERHAIAAAVQSWASAWSRQAVSAYLAHYAPGFADDGLSHKAWVAQRRARVQDPKHISVQLSDLAVRLDGDDRASASFSQHYVSNTLNSTVRKVLDLRRVGGAWKITRESVR